MTKSLIGVLIRALCEMLWCKYELNKLMLTCQQREKFIDKT